MYEGFPFCISVDQKLAIKEIAYATSQTLNDGFCLTQISPYKNSVRFKICFSEMQPGHGALIKIIAEEKYLIGKGAGIQLTGYPKTGGHEMTFRAADKMVRNDGWMLESVEGSHYHYSHKTKLGKVTIPYHSGDLPKRVLKSIKKQAGLK